MEDSLKQMPRRPSALQLRAFNEVIVQGSFSAAARALGVSQPAITAQVRALEEQFETRLFERMSTGVLPTPVGRRLFAETEALRDTETAAADVLMNARQLRFGELAIVSGAPGPVMPLVSKYQDQFPGVRVTVEFGNWETVVGKVRDRSADLGLLTSAPQNQTIHQLPFLAQSLVALVPKAHPLSKRTEISLVELTRERVLFRTKGSLTQRSVDHQLRKLGISVAPALVLEAREAIYEACASGVGIGFMFDAASTRTDGVTRVRIKEFQSPFFEDAFCLKTRKHQRVVAAMFELIADQTKHSAA